MIDLGPAVSIPSMAWIKRSPAAGAKRVFRPACAAGGPEKSVRRSTGAPILGARGLAEGCIPLPRPEVTLTALKRTASLHRQPPIAWNAPASMLPSTSEPAGRAARSPGILRRGSPPCQEAPPPQPRPWAALRPRHAQGLGRLRATFTASGFPFLAWGIRFGQAGTAVRGAGRAFPTGRGSPRETRICCRLGWRPFG